MTVSRLVVSAVPDGIFVPLHYCIAAVLVLFWPFRWCTNGVLPNKYPGDVVGHTWFRSQGTKWEIFDQ